MFDVSSSVVGTFESYKKVQNRLFIFIFILYPLADILI